MFVHRKSDKEENLMRKKIQRKKKRGKRRGRYDTSNERCMKRDKKMNRGLWFMSRGNLMQIYVAHNMPLTYIPHGRR